MWNEPKDVKVRDRGGTTKLPHLLRRAAVALAVSATVLGAAEAIAGDCTKTNRTYLNKDGNVAVHTVVRAKTRGKAFEVRIARNGTQKSDGYIYDGKSDANYLMKGGAVSEFAVTVEILRRDGQNTPTLNCAYTVTFSQSDAATKWFPPDGGDGICGDVTELCHECKLTCEKSYHPGTERWNTVLTIED